MGTQDEDFGHRILQENSGNHWNMEAVFRWIPFNFLCFPTGILLLQHQQNYPEMTVFGPDCWTWEV
jgi:hypothetical protein